MDKSDIERLNEEESKAVLDFFAKKAYGASAYVGFNEFDDCVRLSIYENREPCLILFKFSNSDKYDIEIIKCGGMKKKKFKNVLKIFVDIIENDCFISCLPPNDVPVMMDKNSDIEEALINIELSGVKMRDERTRSQRRRHKQSV